MIKLKKNSEWGMLDDCNDQNCPIEKDLPKIRRIMHSYFYDPNGPMAEQIRKKRNRTERIFAETILEVAKMNNLDPDILAHACWAVILAAVDSFEKALKEGKAAYLGSRDD